MAKDKDSEDTGTAPEDDAVDPAAQSDEAGESGNAQAPPSTEGPGGGPLASREGSGEEAVGQDVASADEGRDRPGRVTARSVPASDDVHLTEDEVQAVLEGMPVGVRNRFVPGTLTVHYASRSVDYPADGAAAVRLLAVLAGRSNDMDHVIADRSDARHGWVMIDRHDVVGAHWTPAADTVPRRITMDPDGELVDAP